VGIRKKRRRHMDIRLMVELDSIVAKGNVSSVLDYLPHLARLSAVVTLSVLGTSVRADPVTSKGSR